MKKNWYLRNGDIVWVAVAALLFLIAAFAFLDWSKWVGFIFVFGCFSALSYSLKFENRDGFLAVYRKTTDREVNGIGPDGERVGFDGGDSDGGGDSD